MKPRQYRVVFCAILFLLILYVVGQAAAPDKQSEDWQIMKDYAQWFIQQHSATGGSCCDVADGRPLFAGEWKEIPGGQYEVFISRTHWAAAPTTGFWLVVPKDKVIGASPVGLPIAWWSGPIGYTSPPTNGMIFCFAPVGGV